MQKHKLLKYTAIALRIIIAIVFLLAGSGKFQTDSTMASNFKKWDLGLTIMFIVGVFEISGAILLLVPKIVIYGCYLLIAVMLGAIVIHILNFEELGFPYLNIALIVVLLLIVYFKNQLLRKPSINHS